MADFDVIVLGGGPGGYLAAERLGHAKKKVLLVEREALPEYAAAAAESVTGDDWADAGAKVVSIVNAVSQGRTPLSEGA